MRLIDAFEWLVDSHTETMTKIVRQGERFMVRGSANSKIMASFLQGIHNEQILRSDSQIYHCLRCSE
jgi:hypothetical protein